MKYMIPIAAALVLAASSAFAGCGKKVASIGKLEKFDAATKTLTVAIVDSSNPAEVTAKTATLTLTPDSKVIDGDKIEGVKLENLVGKSISVVSEHGKVDIVITLTSKS